MLDNNMKTFMAKTYDKMCDAIEEWCKKFARLVSDAQKVENPVFRTPPE
jgi:predicted transcriptional regulator